MFGVFPSNVLANLIDCVCIFKHLNLTLCSSQDFFNLASYFECIPQAVPLALNLSGSV